MEELHANARALLDGEQWIEAINLYKRLERDYPYSKYAVQSQMELVYAYYQNSEPELAISLASDLIRTHQSHPHLD